MSSRPTSSRPPPRGRGPLPVFLIDDNRHLRHGLASMLSAQGLKMLPGTGSAAEALRRVRRLKPRLVLLDAGLGDADGLRLVAAIGAASPGTRIIMMHLVRTDEDVVAYVRAGVSGFVMKDASREDFLRTIFAVADGRSVLPIPLADSLFSFVAAQRLSRGRRGAGALMRMTKRERQVMKLIAEGLGNRAIGERLGIASHTVKSHVHNLLEKLALRSRLEVAALARSGDGGARSGGRS